MQIAAGVQKQRPQEGLKLNDKNLKASHKLANMPEEQCLTISQHFLMYLEVIASVKLL